ncbi:hypothetical protein AUP68_07154 [Ilyonectria robusta]
MSMAELIGKIARDSTSSHISDETYTNSTGDGGYALENISSIEGRRTFTGDAEEALTVVKSRRSIRYLPTDSYASHAANLGDRAPIPPVLLRE